MSAWQIPFNLINGRTLKPPRGRQSSAVLTSSSLVLSVLFIAEMKFFSATIAAAAAAILALVAKAQYFEFQAFSEENCNGTPAEEWYADNTGDHVGQFTGPRYAFLIVATDYTCDLITWTDDNESEEQTDFFNDFPGVGECAWTTGDPYYSFDIYCN